jgi:superfamily I DNA/RNA helicase
MQVTRYFGPPGTGKTTQLLRELDTALAAGVRPDRIAFVSFTRAARREALSRALHAYPGLTRDDFPYIRTLHALCFHALGAHASIVNTGAEGEFSGLAGFPMTPLSAARRAGDELDPFEDVRLAYQRLDSLRRVRRWTVEDALRHTRDARIEDWRFRHYVTAWERFKARRDLLDFTDLLERAMADPTRLPAVDVLIVDEAQDLSPLQWQVVDALAANGVQHLIVAGDDDQGIFAWAGADPLALVRRPVTTSTVLARSWRLPELLVPMAQRIVAPIHGRAHKPFQAERTGGELRHIADTAAAALVGSTPGDVLVLSRTRRGVSRLRSDLMAAGVPFTQTDGMGPIDLYRDAILAWGNATVSGWVSQADRHALVGAMLPRPRRRVGGPEDIRRDDFCRMWGVDPDASWMTALDGIPEADRLYLRRWIVPPHPTTRLSTIHAAKGAEADHVFLDIDPNVADAQDTMAGVDDERRVWYVGATRAKESLTFVGYDHNPYLPTLGHR